MVDMLDSIAHRVTMTPRPLTAPISVGAPFKESTVIKRGYSAWTECVTILPRESQKSWDEIVQGSQEVFNDMWLEQSYEHLLKSAGEVRAFFINSNLRYTVHTCPKPDSSGPQELRSPGLYSELVTSATPD